MNAPFTFLTLIDQFLFKFDFFRCCLDDAITFFATIEKHMNHLQLVFAAIKKHGLRLKHSKYFLFQEIVALFGHIVDRNGVRADPD